MLGMNKKKKEVKEEVIKITKESSNEEMLKGIKIKKEVVYHIFNSKSSLVDCVKTEKEAIEKAGEVEGNYQEVTIK